MKKILIATMICLLIFLTACGSKSALQEATGANSQQNITITETLESVGIQYEMINVAKNNKPDIVMADEMY